MRGDSLPFSPVIADTRSACSPAHAMTRRATRSPELVPTTISSPRWVMEVTAREVSMVPPIARTSSAYARATRL